MLTITVSCVYACVLTLNCKSYQYWIYIDVCRISNINDFGFSVKLPAPASVSVDETSADSIKVSWTPAPTASSVSVTYFINVFLATYQIGRGSVTDSYREVVISGLHPFAEYYITVQAGNPGGLSEPTGTSATTLAAGENCHIHLQGVVLYVSTDITQY